MKKILAAAAMLAVAGAANAAVSGVIWRPVDNSSGAGDAQWDALAGNQFTFDLVLLGDAGQRINGINMGDAAFPDAAPFALFTNGSVFNHTLGSNVRNAAFENLPGFTGLRFDTFVAMGSDVPGPTISFAGQVDLNANGTTDTVMRATWFTTDNAVLDANGEMRILRVTVSYADGFDPYVDGGVLGTQGVIGQEGGAQSSIQVGLPGGELANLVIGNAFEIPTPGATALLGLAGLVGLRRRR